MKMGHSNLLNATDDTDAITHARNLEKSGDLLAAAVAWKKVLQRHPLNTKAYDRLMIIYRKSGQLAKEMAVLNNAIRVHEAHNKKTAPIFSKKIVSISKSILKAVELGDEKGNNIYLPGELAKWKRRKALLQKKMSP